MFKQLRNKFILLNVGITATIVFVAFALIYMSSTHSADLRPPIREDSPSYTTDVQNIINTIVVAEKNSAAKSLLTTLIIAGISIEIIVALISYFLAEEFIKPVKNAYQSQKVFIANASHEIKTPLAAISANLEAADLKNNKWIKNVELETEKLAQLNNNLLSLARTDLITAAQPPQITNLQQLVQNELKSISPRLQTEHKHLSLTTKFNNAKDLKEVKINRQDFQEILNILVDNAIKYGDREIIVTLSPHILSIKNDGELLKPNELTQIFERFYQTDKSAAGVGLGLSIAKSLAERNHWKLHARVDHNLNAFSLEF